MPATPKEETSRPEILDDTSAEAIEMKPILAELLPQLLSKTHGTKLNDLPAYQAIRAQDAAYQRRVALALAAAINQQGSLYSNPLRWEMGEVLAALMRTSLPLTEAGQTGDLLKIHLKTQEILAQAAGTDELPVVVFAANDPLGQALGQFVAGLDRADPRTAAWLTLLQCWSKATAGQPTAKLRKELDVATAAIGPGAVRAQGRAWLQLLSDTSVVERPHVHDYDDGTVYNYSSWDTS